MKPAAPLLCAIAVLATVGAWAGTEVDVSKTVEPDGIVRVENPRGEIVIVGWDRDEVRVEGEIDDLADGLEFEVSGSETLVRVALERRRIRKGPVVTHQPPPEFKYQCDVCGAASGHVTGPTTGYRGNRCRSVDLPDL